MHIQNTRRHDIDWLRVIAIALLLIYHTAIGFQYWGLMIGFITNADSWAELWIPMSMLNVWRIPLLFFVSGMGVYFAIQKRNSLALIKERATRILLPFVFGIFCIVPLHIFILQDYYNWPLSYSPSPGHLWFLGNIFIYVIILLPLFVFVKKNKDGKFVQSVQKMLSNPFGLLIVLAAFIAEALLVKPATYEMYAMTWHGFFLGFLAFFFGFCFTLSGKGFWTMIRTWRWFFFLLAFTLFLLRMILFKANVPIYLLVAESNSWIFAVFAFAFMYLNKPSQKLSYLSQAAYPIYIIHMIAIYFASWLLFELDIHVILKFILNVIITFLGSFLVYEFIIRRVRFLRPLFGLKKN